MRNSDGRGLANAIVSVVPAPGISGGGGARIAISDERGEWSLLVEPVSSVVAVAAAGFVPSFARIQAIDTRVDLTLTEGGVVLRGTVADIGGGAIANARVIALRSSGSRNDILVALAALTDAAGGYELWVEPGTYVITAAHDDYAEQRETQTIQDGLSYERDFRLRPTSIIRGQVTGGDNGQPIIHATVTASGQSEVHDVLTDDEGRFELRGVASGVNEVSVTARGYASSNPTRVPIGVGEEISDVRIVVERAFNISGRVVARASAFTPIRDVRLGVYGVGRDTSDWRTVRTDAGGNFEILGVKPGVYVFGATSSDHAIASRFQPQDQRVEVVDRDLLDVIVELDRGVLVKGRTMPIGRASVRAECDGVCGEVHDDGTFSFEHLRPGLCTFRAEAPDGSRGETTVTIAPDGANDVLIELKRRPFVTGRVTDSQGRGVPDVTIEADPRQNRYVETSMARSAADGAFRITGLVVGRYRISAPYETDNGVEIDVSESGTAPILLQLATTGQLKGTVVAADGQAVADARVSVMREYPDKDGKVNRGPASSPVYTREDGQFTFDRLNNSAAYTVVAESSRGTSRGMHEHVTDSSTARIVLTTIPSLSGRVTFGSALVENYTIECGSRRLHVSDPNGRYRFEQMIPNRYDCVVEGYAGRASRDVEVTGETTLDLELQPWATVSGNFVDALTGDPVEGAWVLPNVRRATAKALDGTVKATDAQGRFYIGQLPAGTTELHATSSTLRYGYTVLATVEIRPGESRDLGTIEGVQVLSRPGTLGFGGRLSDAGYVVSDVDMNGPAASAGIRVGDTVTTINGRPVAKHLDTLWDGILIGRSYRIGLTGGRTVMVVATKRDL